jgi:hypothetical protein
MNNVYGAKISPENKKDLEKILNPCTAGIEHIG